MMRLRVLFVLLVAGLLHSCVKEEDFDFTDLSVSTWNPEVALPLVNASLGYSDISGLSGAEQITVGSNGRIVIVRKSSIYERSGKSFFTIPDQQGAYSYSLTTGQAQSLNLTGTFSDSVVYSIPFNLSSGQRLDHAALSNGSLRFNTVNQLPYDAQVRISIPSLTVNGVGFMQLLTIPANSSGQAFYFPLSGNYLDLASSIPSNELQVRLVFTVAGSGGSVSAGSGFSIDTRLESLDYSYLDGSIGVVDFQVPIDTITLDLYGNGNNDDYSFADPRLTLQVENSIGVPAQLSGCIVQPIRADGTPVNGSLLPTSSLYPIAYPSVPGVSNETDIVVDAQNSSIVSSYAARPAYIVYTAQAGLNRPQASPLNFITDSSRVRINLKSELPLDGYANRLTLRDTSEFNLDAIGEVDSLVFRIETRNGMPVDGRVQILFLQNGFIIDSLFHTNDFYLVEATSVDANGFAVGANIMVHDEPLGQERLQRIYDADTVIFRAIMNTTSPPTRVVIRDVDHLDMKLGVRTKLKIDSN